MGNFDTLQILQALGGGGMMQQMPQTQPQQMPGGLSGSLLNMRNQQQNQQYQQPSWMDALNHSMMLSAMIPQQQPFMMGGMGGGYGQQQQPQNWWQKGLTGLGTSLSGISQPATTFGVAGTTMAQPWGPLVAGGGIAAGGLGNLLQYLGQPGMQQ